jgi:hypothetical protein
VSETEDLELEALQRQLDDAFETTRPRPGFEDELWARMQAHRPATSRLRDAWLGLIQGIREVPAVPMAAVAAVLVVIIGAGLFAYSGLGRGAGSATTSLSAGQNGPQSDHFAPAGAFGRLPGPVLNPGTPDKSAVGATAPNATAPGATYTGPFTLTWKGTFALALPAAPVFRYQEPSTNVADQFATSLGAILHTRPAGYLGSYDTTDFNVLVRGTVQSPAHEPSFSILPIKPIAPIDAAGGPADVAVVILAQHSLVPMWPFTPQAVVSGDKATVTLLRQFAIPAYGNSYLVDRAGDRYGMEVDLQGNTLIRAAGPLPLSLESASYPIISGDEAVRSVLASAPPAAANPSAPVVTLTTAELVYTLVTAGDHSFYEPAILFSGTFTLSGKTYDKRILVPAVDPSQRSS